MNGSIKAVLINDTRVDRHHGCTRVVHAIGELAAKNGISIIATHPAHSDWREDSSFLEQFRGCDLVLVNGEGTIHHNQPSGVPLLAAGAAARDSGKRSALLNFSWQGNDAEWAKRLLDFDFVSVRESSSLAEVSAVRPDCRLVPDLSLYGQRMDFCDRAEVGFGDSVIPSVTDKLLGASRRFAGRPMPIRYPGHGLQSQVSFVRSFASRSMLRSMPEVTSAVRIGAWNWRNSAADPTEYLERLAHLKLLVTGRFHGVALALCAGTPVLAVPSNSRKIEGLMADAGLEPWRIVEPADLSPDLIARAAQWHHNERKALKDYLGRSKREGDRLFADIRESLH